MVRSEISYEDFKKLCENENLVYIIYKNKAYEVSKYLRLHPGGSNIILENRSKDITKIFDAIHPHINLENILENYQFFYIKI